MVYYKIASFLPTSTKRSLRSQQAGKRVGRKGCEITASWLHRNSSQVKARRQTYTSTHTNIVLLIACYSGITVKKRYSRCFRFDAVEHTFVPHIVVAEAMAYATHTKHTHDLVAVGATTITNLRRARAKGETRPCPAVSHSLSLSRLRSFCSRTCRQAAQAS